MAKMYTGYRDTNSFSLVVLSFLYFLLKLLKEAVLSLLFSKWCGYITNYFSLRFLICWPIKFVSDNGNSMNSWHVSYCALQHSVYNRFICALECINMFICGFSVSFMHCGLSLFVKRNCCISRFFSLSNNNISTFKSHSFDI